MIECLFAASERIMANMAFLDPSLHLGPAVSLLLATCMDIHLRLQRFVDYPIRLY